MTHSKTKILFLFFTAVMLVGCGSNNKSKSEAHEEVHLEESELPYGVSDTINGEKVSTECAITNYNLEELQKRVEAVKSPDMLMRLKAAFQQTLDSLTQGVNAYTDSEQKIIDTDCQRLKEAYTKACIEYEVPAEGVIANLKDCIKRVRQTNSAIELNRFMDCRIGMLNHLDIIHLCIANNSPRIDEVKTLSLQLKTELEKKKRQFHLN